MAAASRLHLGPRIELNSTSVTKRHRSRGNVHVLSREPFPFAELATPSKASCVERANRFIFSMESATYLIGSTVTGVPADRKRSPCRPFRRGQSWQPPRSVPCRSRCRSESASRQTTGAAHQRSTLLGRCRKFVPTTHYRTHSSALRHGLGTVAAIGGVLSICPQDARKGHASQLPKTALKWIS